jgi:hypothetical protein
MPFNTRPNMFYIYFAGVAMKKDSKYWFLLVWVLDHLDLPEELSFMRE